jgi:hypothetical protein
MSGVESVEKASMVPLVVATMAMFEVNAPSSAFRVEASGCAARRRARFA